MLSPCGAIFFNQQCSQCFQLIPFSLAYIGFFILCKNIQQEQWNI